MNIKIVTDSTVDLPEEIVQKYGLEIVPLAITIDDETFLDRVDINAKDFIKRMSEAKELPKSSQPSTGAFLEVYDRLGEEGYEVLSIHMTGGMSGTVRSAESAASMSKAKVTVVDSRYISLALSFQVIEAAIMAKEGKTVEEIVDRLNVVRDNSRLFIMVDTLENLSKGGRIGKGRAMIGSLLNIKPIASLEGGEYTPVAKMRSHSQVVKFLTKQMLEDVSDKSIKRCGLVHAEGYELASKVKEAITKETGFEDIDIFYTTPTISTHTGAGTIALMYQFE